MENDYFIAYDKNHNKVKIGTLNKCNLGDIVRVSDFGFSYTTYVKAFEYFNILHKCRKVESIPNFKFYVNETNEKCCNDTNWVIINMAVHPILNTVLYCLKNHRNEFLVIGDMGVELVKNCKNKSNIGFVKEEKILDYIPE